MKLRARSEEEKKEKRDVILAAARALFGRLGYSGTTIELITAEAGLSPAAFYRYFSGKLEIYRSLTALGGDILGEMIAEATDAPGIDAESRLRAAAGAYLGFFRRHRDYYDIIAVLHLGQGEFFADLDMVPFLEERALALLGMIEDIIRKGIEEGLFRTVDARKTAAGLWGMMDGLLILEVKGSTGFIGASLEEVFDEALDLAIRGLRADRR